jgi:hypothetical protein
MRDLTDLEHPVDFLKRMLDPEPLHPALESVLREAVAREPRRLVFMANPTEPYQRILEGVLRGGAVALRVETRGDVQAYVRELYAGVLP